MNGKKSTTLDYQWWRKTKSHNFFNTKWFSQIYEKEPRFKKLMENNFEPDEFQYENIGKMGLVVWHEPDGKTIQPVGLIAYIEEGNRPGRTVFCYHPEYVADPETRPISKTLPKTTKPYECQNEKHLLPFFDNLVTESALGMAQENACRELKRIVAGLREQDITPDAYQKITKVEDFEGRDNAASRFARLITFGRGFHGAVSVVDVALPDQIGHWEEQLVDEDLQSVSSIGGAHPKVLGVKVGDHYEIAPKPVTSTHIIKMGDVDYPHLVENEYLNYVASRALLPKDDFSEVQLTHLGNDPKPVLAVKRFDRTDRGGRVHFEELLQLAGRPADTRGDQSVYDLGNWIKAMTPSKEQQHALMQKFFKRIITQWLLGNADGHAKNFGLWQKDGVVEFTPNYDLVSTDIYGMTALMLPIAEDKKLLQQVRPEHIVKLGKCLGLHDLKEVDALVKEVLMHKDEAVQKLKEVNEPLIDPQFRDDFINCFESRCKTQYGRWDAYVRYCSPGSSLGSSPGL